MLPYSLPSLVVFTSSISSFFYCSDTNSGLESNSEESADLMGVLNHLSDFLASVLFIDMIEDTVTTENILEVFIKNHSGAGFCGKVIDSAQTYIEHRV